MRAGWSVIAELCERTGAGIEALTAPMVTAMLTEAVPFYAGITLEEIGGLGVRWQERDAAASLPAGDLSNEALVDPPPEPRGLRVTDAPSLWRGPETEHSPSLRFLSTRARAELSVEDARQAGVANGDEIRLLAGGSACSATVVVRTGVAAGSVFLSGADLPDGEVRIEPARPTVEAVAAGEVHA